LLPVILNCFVEGENPTEPPLGITVVRYANVYKLIELILAAKPNTFREVDVDKIAIRHTDTPHGETPAADGAAVDKRSKIVDIWNGELPADRFHVIVTFPGKGYGYYATIKATECLCA
jgi:hypothetical protein